MRGGSLGLWRTFPDAIEKEEIEHMTVEEYWRNIRSTEAGIMDEWPWLVSLEDRTRGLVGGRLIQVSREQAAKLIYDGAYRLATPAEIAEHLAAEDARRQETIEQARKQAGIVLVAVPTKRKK